MQETVTRVSTTFVPGLFLRAGTRGAEGTKCNSKSPVNRGLCSRF